MSWGVSNIASELLSYYQSWEVINIWGVINIASELGTRYFESNHDIGTDTLLKKYHRYR